MNILVTGAAGYIGRYVVTNLINSGHTVFAVDLKTDEIDTRANILDLDIFSGNKDIFNLSHCPDLCIHLAWQDGFVHNSYKHMENLSKHFIFLKNMIEGGCKRIAVMGTMHEIGFWEGKVDENTPCKPLSQYGVAKNALRQSLEILTKNQNINFYWLRAFYILGDDTKNNSIFTKLLKAVEEGKQEFPFTTGLNQYDFISIQELANQIVSAVTQDEITGIINVCSGKPVMLKDQVNTFIKEHNLNITLKYGVFPERPYDSKIIYGDSTKITHIMNQ